MKVNNYVEMLDCFIPKTLNRYSRCIGERSNRKVGDEYELLLKCWKCPWIRREKDTGRFMGEKELLKRKKKYEKRMAEKERRQREKEERLERESHYGEYI